MVLMTMRMRMEGARRFGRAGEDGIIDYDTGQCMSEYLIFGR